MITASMNIHRVIRSLATAIGLWTVLSVVAGCGSIGCGKFTQANIDARYAQAEQDCLNGWHSDPTPAEREAGLPGKWHPPAVTKSGKCNYGDLLAKNKAYDEGLKWSPFGMIPGGGCYNGSCRPVVVIPVN